MEFVLEMYVDVEYGGCKCVSFCGRWDEMRMRSGNLNVNFKESERNG